MVPIPHSESKSDFKRLRYIWNKIYNGYSGTPDGQNPKKETVLELYAHNGSIAIFGIKIGLQTGEILGGWVRSNKEG